jgi:proline iminopeptidase
MKVSDLHTVAYWTYGNKAGKPVLFVHGGPGGGTSPDLARFFNPRDYHIVLVDQRGCGKSTPLAELRENNTQALISDFEKIREALGIEKWMVFGGSWGSTLSLAYALAHPERVTELVIRGIFFCSKPELDWTYEPGGSQNVTPEAWKKFEDALPAHLRNKGNNMKLYQKCMRGDYGPKKKEECLLAWTIWEDSNSSLIKKPMQSWIDQEMKTKEYKAMSPIENHYFNNRCFLPPNYFLSKKSLDILKKIPMTIVQGMYDMECPFTNAYHLHKALPHSRFFPTMAGHTALDKENVKYLVQATDYYARGRNIRGVGKRQTRRKRG